VTKKLVAGVSPPPFLSLSPTKRKRKRLLHRLGFTGVYKGLQGFAWVTSTQGFTRDYKGLQGFPRVYGGSKVFTWFTRVYRGLQWVKRNLQGLTGVYKGLQGFTVCKSIRGHNSEV